MGTNCQFGQEMNRCSAVWHSAPSDRWLLSNSALASLACPLCRVPTQGQRLDKVEQGSQDAASE